MKNILSDVKPEHYFWLSDGTVIKNLHELHEAMSRINDDIFKHHVNDQKNDFCNWVRDIHQDKKLANNLLKAKTKEEIADYTKKRIQEIESTRKIKQTLPKVTKKQKVKIKVEKKETILEIKPETKEAAKKIKILHKKAKELDNLVFRKFSGLKKKITQPEMTKEIKQLPAKSYTLSGTIIALAALIGLVAVLNLPNKPGIIGAAITDLQYVRYTGFVVISSIIIITMVILILARKKR